MMQKIPNSLIKEIANKFWQERNEKNIAGSSEGDWQNAIDYIKKHPFLSWKWRIIQSLKKIYRSGVTTTQSIFHFSWKTLPSSEWVKLLAVPVVLSVAGSIITTRFQKENKQNERVIKYFDQMEKLFLDEKLDIAEPDNKIRQLIKLRSIAILRSSDLKRQEIVINFLAESDLLDRTQEGVSLNYYNLETSNLSGLNLTRVTLKNAFLRRANLEGTILKEAILQQTDLRNADLRNTNLERTNLQLVNLKNATLERAYLFKVDLGNADLRNANLKQVELTGEAYLVEANLENANLESANLEQAILIGANLNRANLAIVNLNRANLENANLNRANLDKVTLYESFLRGTYLYQARNLTPTQIKTACAWEEAIYTKATWSDKDNKWIPNNKAANQTEIEKLKNDPTSNPQSLLNCSP